MRVAPLEKGFFNSERWLALESGTSTLYVYVYVSVFPIEKVDVLLFMDRSYNVLKQLESGGVFFYIYNINFCRIYPPVS